MSQYKKTDEIFIVTTKLGYIPQLRTSGPIPNPFKVPVGLCLEMVIAGIQLFQYQVGTGKLVELTIDNIYDADKFEDKVEEVDTEEEVATVEETEVTGVKLDDDDVKTDSKEEVITKDKSTADTTDATDKVADDVKTDSKEEVTTKDKSTADTTDATDKVADDVKTDSKEEVTTKDKSADAASKSYNVTGKVTNNNNRNRNKNK